MLASGRGIDNPDYAKDSGGILAGIVGSEAAVRENGLEWTISRPGWFAQNFSEGFVDAEDIAAVVVAALTEDRHAGQIYELSGPRAVTLTEAVATISEATGREIRYVPLSVDAYVAELIQQGLPPADAEAFADVIEPLREGLELLALECVHERSGARE